MAITVGGTTITFNDGTVQSSAAIGVKAWVNFNGVTTATIRASYNVSSVTRNGTGDYTVNFTTAMPDTNYCFTASGSSGGNTDTVVGGQSFNSRTAAPPTTTSLRGFWKQGNQSGAIDCDIICISVFR